MQENNNEQNENLNSTVQTTNVEPNVLPVEETVVTPENVVEQPVEPTTSQPQDNYLSGIVPPQTESKKNNNKLIIGVVVAILLVMVVLCIIKMLPKVEKETNVDNTTTTKATTTTKPIEEEKTSPVNYDLKKNTKSYFVENTLGYEVVQTVEKEDKVLGEYTCKTDNCNVFDSVSSSKALVYDDYHYFMYDYKIKKETNVNLPNIEYSDAHVVEYKSGIGIILEKNTEGYNNGFYDVTSSKMLIDFGKYPNISYSKESSNANCLVVEMPDDFSHTKVYNISKQTFEKDEIADVLSNGTTTYYLGGYQHAEGFTMTKVYTEKSELIVDLNGEAFKYVMTDDGKLIYTIDDKKFSIIANNKVLRESATYEEIYAIDQDGIAVNKNNSVVIIDSEEKEIAKIVDLTKTMEVFYVNINSEQIDVTIADENADSDYIYIYDRKTKEVRKEKTTIGEE